MAALPTELAAGGHCLRRGRRCRRKYRLFCRRWPDGADIGNRHRSGAGAAPPGTVLAAEAPGRLVDADTAVTTPSKVEHPAPIGAPGCRAPVCQMLPRRAAGRRSWPCSASQPTRWHPILDRGWWPQEHRHASQRHDCIQVLGCRLHSGSTTRICMPRVKSVGSFGGSGRWLRRATARLQGRRPSSLGRRPAEYVSVTGDGGGRRGLRVRGRNAVRVAALVTMACWRAVTRRAGAGRGVLGRAIPLTDQNRAGPQRLRLRVTAGRRRPHL